MRRARRLAAGLAVAGLAMVALAVAALALALALRFGSPSALLGLAGGLAAPAMIGSAEPNVPLLMLYLALAVGGLTAVSRRQRWAWLGIGALVGGFGWGLTVGDFWWGVLAALIISVINGIFGFILRPQSKKARRRD